MLHGSGGGGCGVLLDRVEQSGTRPVRVNKWMAACFGFAFDCETRYGFTANNFFHVLVLLVQSIRTKPQIHTEREIEIVIR